MSCLVMIVINPLSVASGSRVSQVLSFATALLQSDSSSIGLPDFPISSLHRIVSILVSEIVSLVCHLVLMFMIFC